MRQRPRVLVHEGGHGPGAPTGSLRMIRASCSVGDVAASPDILARRPSTAAAMLPAAIMDAGLAANFTSAEHRDTQRRTSWRRALRSARRRRSYGGNHARTCGTQRYEGLSVLPQDRPALLRDGQLRQEMVDEVEGGHRGQVPLQLVQNQQLHLLWGRWGREEGRGGGGDRRTGSSVIRQPVPGIKTRSGKVSGSRKNPFRETLLGTRNVLSGTS